MQKHVWYLMLGIWNLNCYTSTGDRVFLLNGMFFAPEAVRGSICTGYWG